MVSVVLGQSWLDVDEEEEENEEEEKEDGLYPMHSSVSTPLSCTSTWQ